MTYTKPLVSKLDTTTEIAMCRPCLTVDGFRAQVGPVTVVVDPVSTGGRCPVSPAPGTPNVNGIDTVYIGDVGSVSSQSIEANVAGYDVAVGL